MKLEKLQRDWNSIADVDALWGILSAKDKKGGRWDVNEFFQSGIKEIAALMGRIEQLGIEPKRENALDFGCGAGRLTQALAAYFTHCVGVDISPNMIELAKKNNRFGEKVKYMVNSAENLEMFPSGSFDFIYSVLTLQHMASPYAKGYVKELARTLRPGGLLVFQMISYLPWLFRLQPKRRVYAFLRALGLPTQFLFYRFNLAPIRMTMIRESDMVGLLKTLGCTVRHIDRTKLDTGIVSCVYFVTGV